MRIKLDENLPADLLEWLRDAGHDVCSVADEGLAGYADPPVLRAAALEERILMTFDTDFADIRRYPLGTHAGIVVFRLRDQRWVSLRTSVRRLLATGALRELTGGLAIVHDTRVRFRRPSVTEAQRPRRRSRRESGR